MKSCIIIPSRYDSKRFPGKLLADLEGKSVIARTLDQCRKVQKVDRIIVATDDERIRKEVEKEGGEAVMTDPEHRSGTDRCAEALERTDEDPDVVVNVQGDEPFILPEQIDTLITLFQEPSVGIGTLCRPIRDEDEFASPHRVKVVFSPTGDCLYFSRSPIPYSKGTADTQAHQHIGIYGYRSDLLPELASLEPTPLEEQEGLEQLRWLENGYRIRTGITKGHDPGIDSPEDLERAKAYFSRKKEGNVRSGKGSA